MKLDNSIPKLTIDRFKRGITNSRSFLTIFVGVFVTKMDKSWMTTDRTQQAYIDGVASFLKFASSNLKTQKIPCPCVSCLNYFSLKVQEVDDHLFIKGFDPTYTRWVKHGEKDEPATEDNFTEGMEFFEFEFPTDAIETVEMVKATEENFTEDPKKFEELIANAENCMKDALTSQSCQRLFKYSI